MQPQRISKKQIQYIQTERRRAGIDDDTYAAMKRSVGVESTTELNNRQFDELMRRIGKLKRRTENRRLKAEKAYKPVHSSAYASGMHVAPPEDKAAMVSKVEAILADLKLPWSYVDGMAKKRFGVDLFRWLDVDQTYKVLQMMVIHQQRTAQQRTADRERKTEKPASKGEAAPGWKFYFDELKSDGCVCGREKKPGRSFCYDCWQKLPPELQRPLYKRIGSGYEAAYEAAHTYLTREGG